MQGIACLQSSTFAGLCCRQRQRTNAHTLSHNKQVENSIKRTTLHSMASFIIIIPFSLSVLCCVWVLVHSFLLGERILFPDNERKMCGESFVRVPTVNYVDKIHTKIICVYRRKWQNTNYYAVHANITMHTGSPKGRASVTQGARERNGSEWRSFDASRIIQKCDRARIHTETKTMWNEIDSVASATTAQRYFCDGEKDKVRGKVPSVTKFVRLFLDFFPFGTCRLWRIRMPMEWVPTTFD